MHILLFIFYTLLICWILLRRPFFKDLRPGWLLAFFLVRVGVGCLHNLIAYKYYPQHGDIWRFFQDSFTTRHDLSMGLSYFWARNAYLVHPAYWPHNIIEWMHILFNFLSFDNLYINTLFFSFLTLGGQIALFRVFYEKFGRDAISGVGMLLLPSVLFWTSCIHTEGIIYALLGWLFYGLHRALTKGWTAGLIIRALLLTGLIILLRPALAIGLLPALAIWLAGELHMRRITFFASLGALILLIVGLDIFKPAVLNKIPRALSERQQEYLFLNGNSRIPLPTLQPTWNSLRDIIPDALFNGFCQPLPGVGGQNIYLAFSLELMAIGVIIGIAFIIFVVNGARGHHPYPSFHYPRFFAAASLLLAFLGILLIGCIIPFVGAIVRYRSIYLPLFLPPYLATLHDYPAYRRLNNKLIRFIFK
ncbi:MAG TPA: hypothetical protein VHD83_16740 [Puia sp.]|nr:hypothetical protein [Puia sp.]